MARPWCIRYGIHGSRNSFSCTSPQRRVNAWPLRGNLRYISPSTIRGLASLECGAKPEQPLILIGSGCARRCRTNGTGIPEEVTPRRAASCWAWSRQATSFWLYLPLAIWPQRTEPFVAKPAPESSAVTEQLMEEVCNRENLVRAWKRVRQNKGGPGVDGMTIDDAKDYLREHWPSIRSQLLAGTYQPQPVKRVEIPKPDGGVRKLGVPCVVDRLIQQALLQVLQGQWDPTFSEHSYGFRPGRSAHQAVAQAQQYIAAGYNVVVDLDLEKFFDRVNHDSLMARVAARVTDKRVLKLIRAFLKAGVMEDGLVSPVDEGTPQGGPLSPLLSNLVL